jgi:hypothetical protein
MLSHLSWVERLLLLCPAAWRLAHLIAEEDGPFEAVAHLREALGDSEAGRAMDCFYCASLWIALPIGFVAGADIIERLLAWLAISGGAALLEQATSHRQTTEGKAP